MDDTFDKLEKQLKEQEWPAVYMFKFIVPNDSEKIAKITALFDSGTDLSMRPSKNGNYVSVGAKELMLNVESIIERYKKAAQIKGVISL